MSGSFDLQVLNAPGNVSWFAEFPDPGNPFTWTSALLIGISNAVPRTTKLHQSHVFITINACDCPVLGDRQRNSSTFHPEYWLNASVKCLEQLQLSVNRTANFHSE